MCNLKENAGIIYTDYKLTRRIEPPAAQTKQPPRKARKEHQRRGLYHSACHVQADPGKRSVTAAALVVGASARISSVAMTAAGVFAAVMAAASAAVSRLKLFGSSVAHGDDRAFEAHVLAGQRVIEIHLDLIVGDIHHESVDAIAVRSHHRKHCSLLDHLGIKFPVYGKHVLFKTSHLIGIMRTECLGSLDSDVKLAAGLQTLDSGRIMPGVTPNIIFSGSCASV